MPIGQRPCPSRQTHTGNFPLPKKGSQYNAHTRKSRTHSLTPLQKPRINLPVKLQQASRSDHDTLILAFAVLDQVTQQLGATVLLTKAPRLPLTYLSYRIDTRRDNLTPDARVHKFLRDLSDGGG